MTIDAREEPDLRLVNEPHSLWRGTSRDVRELYGHRELLRAFVSRELRARYKGASFGWAWALIRPLTMLFIYGVAVGLFLGAGRTIPQFMIFIYAGLIGWTLFSTLVMGCITAVIGNGPLLSRARFPRLLIPLSVLAAALVDFLLQASVLLLGYTLFQDLPRAADLLWLPPSLFVLITFGLGIGMALAAVNVYLRDIAFLADVGLQVAFWMTPVIYAYGQVARSARDLGAAGEWLISLYMLNPMANVAIGLQRALWPAGSSEAALDFAFPGHLALRLALFSLAGGLVVWTGMRIFVKLSANFGQEF